MSFWKISKHMSTVAMLLFVGVEFSKGFIHGAGDHVYKWAAAQLHGPGMMEIGSQYISCHQTSTVPTTPCEFTGGFDGHFAGKFDGYSTYSDYPLVR